jgi:hypothetical protein
MATKKQVTCINKTNRTDYHERISHIGGSWKHTSEDAIKYIENGTYEYYVSKNGHDVKLKVMTRNGRKYLKTENDGDSPDNLLSLPECK